MFERFSSGYYLGRLYVEPGDGEQAAIARAQHEQVSEQLYAGEGVERTDHPLVMKLGNTHFTVGGEADVPADTLVVPDQVVEETDIRNPPTLREVFLAKADRARQLLAVAEGLPATGSDSGAGVRQGDGNDDEDGNRGGDFDFRSGSHTGI
jgi:hypothetical protein